MNIEAPTLHIRDRYLAYFYEIFSFNFLNITLNTHLLTNQIKIL